METTASLKKDEPATVENSPRSIYGLGGKPGLTDLSKEILLDLYASLAEFKDVRYVEITKKSSKEEVARQVEYMLKAYDAKRESDTIASLKERFEKHVVLEFSDWSLAQEFSNICSREGEPTSASSTEHGLQLTVWPATNFWKKFAKVGQVDREVEEAAREWALKMQAYHKGYLAGRKMREYPMHPFFRMMGYSRG